MKNVSVSPLLLTSLVLIGGCGNVNSPPPPASIVISPATAPSGTVGFSYNLTLSATGGTAPYTWTVSTGTLPGGLNLNANTGVLSGVPAASGTSNFTVRASDSSVPSRTGNMPFALVVNPQLSFSSASLPDGTVGVVYNAIASISGGVAPYTWTISSGSLPPGLSLNSAMGAITGTPTATGSFSFGLKVTDSSVPQQTAKFFSGIVIYPLLTITSTSLPDGVVGSSYSTTLTASGGTGTYTWSISSGSLPNGISLDPSTGSLSGTPLAAGQANFTAQVTDTANPPQTATLPLSLNVTAAGANNRLMKGSYAFLLQGFDSSGALAMVGSIDADGAGSITGGILDINRSSGAQANITIDSGTFAINSDNRGTVTIQSALGSQTFQVAMNASGTLAHFIEFESNVPDPMRGNGLMKKRLLEVPSGPAWSGSYAFSFSGSTSTGRRSAFLGGFSASAAGSITSGLTDSNSDSAVVHEAAILDASNYSFAPNGRGTLKLIVAGLGSISGVAYFVSAGESFFMTTDTPSNDLLSGEILQQSGNPFSASALTGASLLHMEGQSLSGSTVAGGLVVGDDRFGLAGIYDGNDGGNVTSKSVSGGSYTMTSSSIGRGTMTFAGHSLVFYMVDSATAFVMDAEGSEVKTGMLERRSAGVRARPFPSGRFAEGTESTANPNVAFESGVLTIMPAGGLFGTKDVNLAANILSPAHALSDTLLAATEGRVTTSSGLIYYVISPTRMIGLEMQSGHVNPEIVVADQ